MNLPTDHSQVLGSLRLRVNLGNVGGEVVFYYRFDSFINHQENRPRRLSDPF